MAFVNDNETIILVLECSNELSRIAIVIIVIVQFFITGNISYTTSGYKINIWVLQDLV